MMLLIINKVEWGILVLYPIHDASHYTLLQQSLTGHTGFILSIRFSIHLSIRPSICLSVDQIMPILYLPQYQLDPFHIYTSYQPT